MIFHDITRMRKKKDIVKLKRKKIDWKNLNNCSPN